MALSWHAQITLLFCCHAASSVSMILLNKTISQAFDFPWTVIFLQNVGTVLLSYLRCSSLSNGLSRMMGAPKPATPLLSSRSPVDLEVAEELMPRSKIKVLGMTIPARDKNRLWVLAQTILFIGTLFTSLRALHYISVPLYVVARNSVPACTAMLEYFVDGTRISLVGFGGLLCTILGAALYTASDTSMDFVGLGYAGALVLIVACCSAVDKASVRIQCSEEGMTPVEVNQLRVALSMPLNLMLIGGLELREFPAVPEEVGGRVLQHALANMGGTVWICLLLSTVFGFGMGTFNFYLQKEVNAATVQVANISYKLLTTVISRTTHPAPVSAESWMGFLVSVAGIAVYTFGPSMLASKTSPQALILKEEKK